MLDNIYLKPNIAAYSSRRLQNTNEAALFLEAVNKHIWDNNIQYKPTIYAMDVTNFFQSVNEDLALPGIAAALKKSGIKQKEIKAVLECLKILRGGSFFKWKEHFWRQVSGCALGDVDSCSYTDLAMAYLLLSMIPATEKALSTSMEWFKIYRDDVLGITFDPSSKNVEIQEHFNNFNDDIQ